MVTTRLRGSKWIRVVFTGVLLIVLVGFLLVYTNVSRRYPIWISLPRTPSYEQEARLMSIEQLSPVLNYMSDEGMFQPGIISWRASRVRALLTVQGNEEDDKIAVPYDLEFHGEYQLILPNSQQNAIEVLFPFPRNLETLHDVQFLVDGDEPENVEYSTSGIRWQDEFISKEEHTISIRYKAEGAYTFTYELPKEQRTDVDVEITVVGLTGSSIPEASLPPLEIESGDDAEKVTWEYANLIDTRNIQIELPREQTFSRRIAEVQFELSDLLNRAPFIIGATMAALAVTFRLRGTRLKIETYLLLGLGLVFFFPLVIFLSGIIGVMAGSLLALLITIGLLVVFLSQTVGWDQIGWQTVLVLVVFLGLFGLGLLTEWSGLLTTVGGVLMLGVFMVLYARRQKNLMELEPIQAQEETEEIEPSPAPEPDLPSGPTLHCPQCSQGLEDDVNFCPSCGYETKQIVRCGHCGREQFPPTGFEVAYCLGCGEVLS
ncbi:MAG: hypothetical protein GTO18_16995 [Anaerolineales bacterium]|nr:hypothetical protein [Anaerolineales bacterium]